MGSNSRYLYEIKKTDDIKEAGIQLALDKVLTIKGIS